LSICRLSRALAFSGLVFRNTSKRVLLFFDKPHAGSAPYHISRVRVFGSFASKRAVLPSWFWMLTVEPSSRSMVSRRKKTVSRLPKLGGTTKMFKRTVHRNFNSVFWHIWTGLGLNTNPFWFYNFLETSTILDLHIRKFSSHR
jgi:hypothetical protein